MPRVLGFACTVLGARRFSLATLNLCLCERRSLDLRAQVHSPIELGYQCHTGGQQERRQEEQEQWVSVFRALGDPTRLQIFRLIAAQTDPLCVCDIVERFAVSQPTISHHLRVLREVGLVTVSRRGIWAYYAADPQGLEQFYQIGGALKLRESTSVG